VRMIGICKCLHMSKAATQKGGISRTGLFISSSLSAKKSFCNFVSSLSRNCCSRIVNTHCNDPVSMSNVRQDNEYSGTSCRLQSGTTIPKRSQKSVIYIHNVCFEHANEFLLIEDRRLNTRSGGYHVFSYLHCGSCSFFDGKTSPAKSLVRVRKEDVTM
jgi:hypothetical protein